MDIASIRQKVHNGNYLIQSHALHHALKEGFTRQEMVDAVLNGQIIEEYPDVQRFLICGYAKLEAHVKIYLHIVCEVADPVYVEFITAYYPDESLWERPDFKKRRRRRR